MKLIKRWRCHFKSTLPQGMTDFNQWIDDVAELSGLPNNDRLRMVIASFITKLPPEMSSFPKMRLAIQLKKAAANQVAFEAIGLIDEKEAASKNGTGNTTSDLGQKSI